MEISNPPPLSTRPNCSRCEDTGWVKAGGDRQGVVACECRREQSIRQKLPARYYQARLTDFSAEVVVQVQSWLLRPSDGLLLTGPAGTGKTHLAAALVRECVERDLSITFRRASALYAAIRESYSTHALEEDVLGPYVEERLLVLDDLGAGGLSDHERRFTLEVLDRRGNELRPTVVTSNWTLAQIGDLLDERIASRLSGFTQIAFAGRDRRMQHPSGSC